MSSRCTSLHIYMIDFKTSKWNRIKPGTLDYYFIMQKGSFGRFWECGSQPLSRARSLRSQAMGRFCGQNFSKFVWRIVANSYQGMVKGSLWGSAWVENLLKSKHRTTKHQPFEALDAFFKDGKVQPSFRITFGNASLFFTLCPLLVSACFLDFVALPK